jgi:hypothetical protein
MNHGKHVTPEEVSMSTNLIICNILLHGKTTIAGIECHFCFLNILLLWHYIID